MKFFDSIEGKEVLIDTKPIQQLMKEWAERINQSNQEGPRLEKNNTKGTLESRRHNKPSWTRDFIMAGLKWRRKIASIVRKLAELAIVVLLFNCWIREIILVVSYSFMGL